MDNLERTFETVVDVMFRLRSLELSILAWDTYQDGIEIRPRS
ncbi:hypothetical protein [Pseudonocardia yunnanensis]|uniref:Uncharacterized protein n=1 Tax=Pseudonocardia yunnanensis TaxID=58107 RepID=A0ABW4EQR7_9PSEU